MKIMASPFFAVKIKEQEKLNNTEVNSIYRRITDH